MGRNNNNNLFVGHEGASAIPRMLGRLFSGSQFEQRSKQWHCGRIIWLFVNLPHELACGLRGKSSISEGYYHLLVLSRSVPLQIEDMPC